MCKPVGFHGNTSSDYWTGKYIEIIQSLKIILIVLIVYLPLPTIPIIEMMRHTILFVK